MINYSFIIPHHNSPELLNRCLTSIPERDDVQIIVVDDNSNDNKKPRINRHGVEEVYIDAIHSKGAGHARNVGMGKATGKWLLFADCDDYYEEGFLDMLDEYKDKDVDVVYFNYNIINGTTSSIVPDNYIQKAISGYEDENQFLIVKYKNNAPWNKMVKHSLVKDYKIYFEEVVNSNDALFAIWVASCAKEIVVKNCKLYNYIKNTNGLTYKHQSIDEVLCRVYYMIKYNTYTKYIGHPELALPLMKYVLSSIRHDLTRYPVLIITILKLIFDKRLRNRWIDVITSK